MCYNCLFPFCTVTIAYKVTIAFQRAHVGEMNTASKFQIQQCHTGRACFLSLSKTLSAYLVQVSSFSGSGSGIPNGEKHMFSIGEKKHLKATG